MLTVLAWTVFVPALFWNVIFFSVVFTEIVGKDKLFWTCRNIRDTIISLVILFVPGVYLFGLF
jgi:hypothetical protein